MIFNWVQYSHLTYGDYIFPSWAEGIGWGIAALSLVCIPIGMVNALYHAQGNTFLQVSQFPCYIVWVRGIPEKKTMAVMGWKPI